MTSRSSHHQPPSSSTDVVDFNSLVWPPPELRPPPSPVPLIVHGANNQQYKVYPGQSFSEARRLAGIKRSGTPSSDKDDQPQASTSWVPPTAPLKDNRPPLRPKSSQVPPKAKLANGPVDSKSKGRFGCKDYPSGYVPTPRPLSPPVNPHPTVVPVAPTPSRVTPPPPSARSLTFHDQPYSVSTTESSLIPCPNQPQYTTHQSHILPRSQSRNPPMSFFEPYSVVIRPDSANNTQDDFVSPVIENGRFTSFCRISGRTGLSPGGIIERDYDTHSYSTTPQSRDISRSLLIGTESGSTTGTSPQIIIPEGFKEHRASSPTTSSSSYIPTNPAYSSSRSTPYTYPTSRRHSQYDHQETAGPKFTPTRKGYWNRRGDTISAHGRLIPALGASAYPADLAHYPQYALVNEQRYVLLPDTEEERVTMWRQGGVSY